MEPDEVKIARKLKILIEACKALRDSAWFNESLSMHGVTKSQWIAFCKQIKIAEDE